MSRRPLSPHLQTQEENNLVTDHHLYHPLLETNTLLEENHSLLLPTLDDAVL